MSTPQNDRNEIMQQGQADLERILSRSATDHAFRAKLLSSPREAMSEYFGRDIPASVDIHFVENTADATFVLPDAVEPNAELNADELEAVAGGSLSLVLGTIALTIEGAHVIKTIGDDSAWLS